MSEEIKWLIGVILALIAAVGGFIARDRQIAKMISDGDSKLHERINRVRDEYVRQSDLDSHLTRIDLSLKTLTADIKEQSRETARRLDALIAAMTKQ